MLIAGALQSITKGQVARYMLMPQVMPRLSEFYHAGFAHLAYMIALVYRAVNILPQNHVILSRERRLSLGLREVLGAAAAELQLNRHNIDKVIIYFVILLGLVLLAAQFFLMVAYVMVNPALAQTVPTNYGDFFATPNYEKDVAYRLLFTVFGVPEIFRPSGGARTEFHVALHSLFQFYSIGILVIAVIIVCYYIFAVLVETAQTGVPFGKRYNHVWTPIRLVFALGLLIPIGYGLNAAQWITLYSAKFGSDFATQGWIIFNEKMTDAYLKNPDERVGTPQSPEMMQFVGFMMVVKSCEYAYESLYGGTKSIDAYLVKDGESSSAPLSNYLFERALEYFDKGDILIRFGEYNGSTHVKERGRVSPYCGEIRLRTGDATEPGSKLIQAYYFTTIRAMHKSDHFKVETEGENFYKRFTDDKDTRDPAAKLPNADYKKTTAMAMSKEIDEAVKRAVEAQGKSPSWEADKTKVRELGWGGAGIWYNKIAQINGSLVTAVQNIPQITLKPAVLQYIQSEQLQNNSAMPDSSSPTMADGQAIQYNSETDRIIGNALSIVEKYWTGESLRQDDLGNQTRMTDNIFIDTINLIFGTRGLFDMCASADVHPLAQLSTLGKGLIEASIRNLGLAFIAGIGGALPIPFLGAALGAASSLLLSIASITITMGFMLFYVLPFMPFLYFFFAVGGWIKGLFEAMVGVPLWALAHLRIDGEGLPGDAAMDGIYLIFEIFIRPIIIVFGLLASVVIFGAMVKVLNEIFSLVVVNLAGHDPNSTAVCGKGGNSTGGSGIAFFRGPIDELFFTIMYAIIVYMIGMSCFKLIDLVPNNILRYMGSRANSFNDAASDPADGLMLRLSAATSMASSKIIGGGGSIVGGATGALQNTLKAGTEAVTGGDKAK